MKLLTRITKNKVIYYTLQITWGLLMNIIGAAAFAYLIIFKNKKVNRFGKNFYIVTGEKWGGVSFGMFILSDADVGDWRLTHESGHALQNAVYGPFFPILVGLPSAIRYHYRNNRTKKGLPNKTGYYDIWFEKQANDWGYDYVVRPMRRFK